jgi:hypothetical protein
MKPIRIDKCPNCGTTLRERSVEQNSKLHALLHDISTQKQWAGQWLDIEAWKRLLVAAWERSEKRPAEFYPSLDGQGFDVVYRRTSRMNKQEMIDLIDYATAWAVSNDIKLREEKAVA